MPISYDEVAEATPSARPAGVRITGWVDRFPAFRRTSEFDAVVSQIRATDDPAKVAVIESDKGITGNRANYLRRRYPDIRFKQANGVTYASLRPPAEEEEPDQEVAQPTPDPASGEPTE